MKWTVLLSITTLLASSAVAVFRDDAYHIDYHHALLGLPLEHNTVFHKPQIESDASLLYTISEKGIVGAINPRDGSIVWRHALTSAPDRLAHGSHSWLAPGADGQIYTGFGGKVNAWDAMDGRMSWEYKLPDEKLVKGLRTISVIPNESPKATGAGLYPAQEVLFLAGPVEGGSGAVVQRIGQGGEKSTWSYEDSSVTTDTSVSLASGPQSVYVITKPSGLLSGGKVKVVVLNAATGKESSQYNVNLDSQPLGKDGSYVAAGTDSALNPILVSTEKPHKSIKVNVLGSSKVINLSLQDQVEEILQLKVHYSSSTGHLLVEVTMTTSTSAELFYVDVQKGEASKLYTIPKVVNPCAFAATSHGGTAYFARITESETKVFSVDSAEPMAIFHFNDGSKPQLVSFSAIDISVKGKDGIALRNVVLFADGTFALIQNSVTKWSRPELYAYITKTIWSPDVNITSLAQDIEAEASYDPLSAYLHRLSRHLQDLTRLPKYLIDLPTTLLQSSDASQETTQQKLIGGKLVLAATDRQELLAIDAAKSGSVRWRIDLVGRIGSGASAVHLSVTDDRLTAYFSDGSIVVVKVTDGDLVEVQKTTSTFHKIVELPGQPAPAIVKLSPEGKPEVFSDLAPSIPSEGSAIVTINNQGQAVGWSIGKSVIKTWTLSPPPGTKFADMVARPPHDPVASIGKVLGDRSVLYKYISPNLAFLTAVSTTTIAVYLINAITGTVLHTATHQGIFTDTTIPAVISENWFAYSFSQQDPADSGLRTQLVVGELFESDIPNDRGLLSARQNYSSFSPDAGVRPHVLEQAYTLAEPASSLAVSQTIQGITSRQLLAYLPQSNVVIGLPREVANARRIVDRDPTSLEAEEGLFRYNPILDLDPKFFLSHARNVIGIDKIIAAPTLLESTSIVFAHGHDIFGTQVAPSNTFDVLGKNFKRLQLVITVVALYAGVLILRPMVRRQMVERYWL